MKRIATILITTVIFPVFAQAGVIGYWQFESGGFLTDSSGNGNTLAITTDGSNGMTQLALPGSGNGSAFANPIPQTGGANGSIAQFDGGKVGFAAADSASIDQISANGTFTLEAYINAGTISNSSPEDSRYIVANYSTASDRSFSWQINNSEGFTTFLGGAGGSLQSRLISSNGIIQSNKDYYVALVYNANTDTGTYYWQNLTDGGPLLSESTVSDNPGGFTLFNSSQPLTIGYVPSSSKEWSSGALIDQVRVSDMALAESELLTSVPEPSTIALMLGAVAGLFVFVRRRSR